MQKVKVYLMISGDYCAFHEMSFHVVYDITNEIKLEGYTLAELKKWKYSDNGYSDVRKVDAFLIDGVYYYNI